MISLSAHEILKNINDEELQNKIDLHIFQEIDSTNAFLKTLNAKNYLDICSTEQQTQGRGRFGNSWFSPFGENIYLSLRWILHEPVTKIKELSLVVGLSIIKVLENLGMIDDIKIKWPNDIYHKNKKLAGILNEITHYTNNRIGVIIGIGINVNSDFRKLKMPNWTSLFEITNKKQDRNIIIAKLITTIENDLQLFMTNGFEVFSKSWHKYDYLYKKQISLTHMNNKIEGIAEGINQRGELQLTCKSGHIISLNSGEATLLRPLP